MAEKYILMNQNKEVLKFEFDKELNVIIGIDEVYDINFAPLNIKNIDSEKRSSTLNTWFNDRGIPLYRDNAKEITDIFEIDSVKQLINRNYALSVSDQYWFKPENSDIEWKNINYFEKDYDSFTFAEGTYGSGAGKTLGQVSMINSDKTPNNTSSGQLKKVWIKKDGINYLYKGAGTIHNFEPINEVLASEICEILEVPFVKYSLDVIHTKRQDSLVSVCKCAINKDEEIIPAYSVLTEKTDEVTKTISDYYLYLEILEERNVPNAKEYLQKMLMLDYILLNEDRHLANFGVIRNVKTLTWDRICPIFDTGRSMNTNVTKAYWNFNEGEVKCFTNEFISSMELEKIFDVKISKEKIDRLKSLDKKYENMLKEYKEYTKLTDEEIKLLVNGYVKRIDCFEKVVNKIV